jgi:tetratricopeptide (TPR) repeat protein
MKRGKIIVLLLPLVLFLSGCSGTGASLSVLRGNLLFRSGEDALATYRYLLAKQAGREWRDWVDYDLGTLYVSLGELEPGMRVLSGTLEGFAELPEELNRVDRVLFFRSYFNLGVARYESGSFREAAAAFIQALKLKPDSWEAKMNLELSIAAMMKAAASTRVQADVKSPQEGEEAERPQGEELLQSIHEEEKPAWASEPSPEVFEQDW